MDISISYYLRSLKRSLTLCHVCRSLNYPHQRSSRYTQDNLFYKRVYLISSPFKLLLE